MTKINTFILCLLASFFCNIKLNAQIHDFDSLTEHNESFSRIAKAIGDTLDLFDEDKPLQVTLQSDFKNLIKQKFKDEYQEAIFSAMFNDTVQVVRNIEIKPRGNMRKQTCFFPPIKLNFPKKEAYLKQIENFDKLKLVLDCKRGDIYEQYLLSEYYAYKLQNILCEYSLRVRLLHVTYVDNSGKYKDITRYAFLIENINQLGERTNSAKIEPVGAVRDIRTNMDVLSGVYLFQFLIGNTDWSISGNHNMYYLKSMDAQVIEPFVVPYDFDNAGIVNTSYAIPNEKIGTESVRERVYRGYCIDEQHLQKSRSLFIKKKESIYNIFQNDQLLSKSNKRNTIKYLDDFFKIIENENSFKRQIIEACR